MAKAQSYIKMPTNKELEQKLDKLTETVATLVDALPKKEVVAEKVVVEPEQKLNKALGGESEPVPQAYRDEVDKVLNKDFGIHVKGSPDAPTTRFTVLVPLKYSSLSQAELEQFKADIRPKMINNSNALAEVKEWVHRVWENFNPDMKMRIEADRNN